MSFFGPPLCLAGRVARPKLSVDRTLDIPLAEVSGICVHHGADGAARLVAIGDAAGTAVWAEATADSLGSWQEVDLAAASGGVIPSEDCQAEAIAADGSGTFLVMLEEPAVVAVVHPATGSSATITLDVSEPHDLAAAWADDPNSRGEGLVLLAGGHLLVVKEKDPAALIEFGPAGSRPLGLGPDAVLGRSTAWAAPDGPATFAALATWTLSDALADDIDDVSDAAVDAAGRFHLLSDRSSRVVRLAPVEPGQGEVTAEVVYGIEGKPDKAEGLAVLADGRILVALDTKRPAGNLLVLEPPPD